MAKNESKSPAAVAAVPVAPPEPDLNAVVQALAAPFELTEIKFKPQTVSGNRALAVAFVDARIVQERLDDVLGVMNWQDSYEFLPDGTVLCRLKIRIGPEWISKEDVGGPSEQPDEGDRRKAAVSDALKRAAVKFGVGRYLYRLKPMWADYDPQKRQFVRLPQLPADALPKPKPRIAEEAPAPDVVVAPVPEAKKAKGKPTAAPLPSPTPAPAPEVPAGRGKPGNGIELKKRLIDKDAGLARDGVCKPGDLLDAVTAAGVKAGYDKDIGAWPAEAIDLAIEQTRAFEGRVKRATAA